MNRTPWLRAGLGGSLVVASSLALRNSDRHIAALGAVELVAGALYLWPRASRVAGGALLAVMSLAVLLHGLRGELPALPWITAIALGALWPRARVRAEDAADQEALDIVHLRKPGSFGHLAHLRVARVYLQQLPLGEALERFALDLRRYASARGAAGKFHQTTTVGFVLAIRAALATAPQHESFDAFLARNPPLQSAGCVRELYSAERIDSDLARRDFVLPDRVSVSQRSGLTAA